MEELFGYIVPILAVLGWIFGSFNKDNEEKTKKVDTKPKQSPVRPSGGINNQPRTTTRTEANKMPPEAVGTKSFYEKKQEEITKLKESIPQESKIFHQAIERDGNIHDAIINEKKPKAYSQKTKSKPKVSVSKQLTKQGLAHSVIMAEVLGAPKALRPHRSIIHNRNK